MRKSHEKERRQQDLSLVQCGRKNKTCGCVHSVFYVCIGERLILSPSFFGRAFSGKRKHFDYNVSGRPVCYKVLYMAPRYVRGSPVAAFGVSMQDRQWGHQSVGRKYAPPA